MYATIVLPAHNEEDCIGPLLREIICASRALPVREIIVVDDGSMDRTAERAIAACSDNAMLRIIRHGSRHGQSRALLTGIRAASHDLIVTLDADGQNDPADLGKLFAAYASRQAQTTHLIVAGQRLRRRDSFVRRASSRIANGIRAVLLNDNVRDTGCSLKLFRRQDFLELPFFDHVHRFIPAMMKGAGVAVVLVDVNHRPRKAGRSKYGVWDRLWVGIHDLIGVRWLLKRQIGNVKLEDVL
ncbi:glycosyltransferase family 2 protein [Hyphomicrobium sp. CS1GBMeth3]|uniref:glycosyltransferase family 2 protein n=1 Tax=Hyphomicrobium sp. CS1GBMeth3 TaxID=1892845 RepID=UPI000930FE58|nr:glycosyltransferase family 2 protein [Hyphomicrobium sp. CS1GBMeth3]